MAKKPPSPSTAAAALARLRWKGTSKTERSDTMAKLAVSRWSGLSPEERAAEMSRRRRLGEARKPPKP